MSPVLPYDYAGLPLDDANALRAAADRIRACMARTARDIVEIGRELIGAKERLQHGHFLRWIEAEFGITRTLANHFMNVARHLGEKCSTLEHLPVTALYELAAPSTSPGVRASVVEAIAQGEVITLGDIRQLKLQDRDDPDEDRRPAASGARARPSRSDKESRDPGYEPASLEVLSLMDQDVLKVLAAEFWNCLPVAVRAWFLVEVGTEALQTELSQAPVKGHSTSLAERRLDVGAAKVVSRDDEPASRPDPHYIEGTRFLEVPSFLIRDPKAYEEARLLLVKAASSKTKPNR